MISVIEVYNAVRDLANKDQKGFVSPEMFNSLLPSAQSAIFRKIYESALQGKALRRAGGDLGGEDSLYLKAKNFLSEYIDTQTLQPIRRGASSFYEDSTVFRKPENIHRIISVFADTSEFGVTNVDLIYNSEKISRILNSNLSAPTGAFPVALISNEIEVFPSAIGSVNINFYRNPTSRFETSSRVIRVGDIDTKRQPSYSAETTAGIVIPNPPNCRGFDLPAEFRDEVIKEICKMIGVSLRDGVLIGYGSDAQ
tara:strand:- start:336 stop:1097 length:762 start_codon:yes stop_codon:yes gene_type:complete